MRGTKSNIRDDEGLATHIRRRVHRSLNREDGDISRVRTEVFNSYYGKFYGNEEEGRSSYVTRQVLTTVEWLLPEICKVFLSRNVVKLRPLNKQDEQAAMFETRVLNDMAIKDTETWAAISLWIKDVLISPVGYCKVYMDESKTQKRRKRRYKGLMELELAQILSEGDDNDNLNVYIEGEPEARTINSPQGPLVVFDVEIVREELQPMRPTIESIPPEEVLIDPDHRELSLNNCDFIDHYTRKTHSELVLMGFSEEELENVGAGENDKRFSDESTNRYFYIEENPDYFEEVHPDPSQRLYNVHDVYMKLDWDEDGVAELRRVIMVNTTILYNEEVDYQPFVAMSAIPIPHKHVGMSIAETVMDVQKLATQLTRQLLDNIYKVNRGRVFINEDALTTDGMTLEYLQSQDSEVVPVSGPPGQSLYQEVPNPIINMIQPVLDTLQQEQQLRSGVNPTVSLDPDVLQKATATGMQQASEQLSGRVRHLVKQFAEMGFKEIYLKMHYLLRTYVDREMQLKVYNQWISYNPAVWEDRDRVEVVVGLGMDNVAETTQFALQLLGIQKELMSMGLATPVQIFETTRQLTEAMNIGEVTDFFVDPRSPEYQPPQPPPDPQMEIAKAEGLKAQVMAQKAQFEEKLKQQELMLTAQREQMEAQRDQARAETERVRAMLEEQKTQAEMERAERESLRKHELDLSKLIAEVSNIAAKTRLLSAQTAEILATIGQDPDEDSSNESSDAKEQS